MVVVERQRSNALQAEVLPLRAENSQTSQHADRSGEEVARLQARCHELWRYREPTQCARDEVDHSPELEWMHWEENQRESAVSG